MTQDFNSLLLNNLLQYQINKVQMQQQSIIAANSLYNQIFYQHPIYFLNMNYIHNPYQNPFLSPLFHYQLQNNPTQNFNFSNSSHNNQPIVDNSIKKESIQVNFAKKNQNLKKVRNFKIQNDIQQQFLASRQINKTGKSYKKKNTQSNVMNQTFSYMRDQNSLKIVQRLLSYDQNKIKDYYKLINRIKKQNKKYVNRKYLKRLMEFEKKTQFNRVFDKCKLSHLSFEEVRVVLRKLVFFYLRDLSLCTLLTSTKINKDTLREHFWRKRQIFAYLFSSAGAKEDQ